MRLLCQIRYHHDGKYNVLSLAGPVEIYGKHTHARVLSHIHHYNICTVEKPATMEFDDVKKTLARVVPLCLDSEPSLIPDSCKDKAYSDAATSEDDHRDPDDFRFWSEKQAKRISLAFKQSFGVELTPEVIIADANLSTLANRILVARQLLSN